MNVEIDRKAGKNPRNKSPDRRSISEYSSNSGIHEAKMSDSISSQLGTSSMSNFEIQNQISSKMLEKISQSTDQNPIVSTELHWGPKQELMQVRAHLSKLEHKLEYQLVECMLQLQNMRRQLLFDKNKKQ